MLLGAHMSVSGGLSTAFERAQSIGINTMQVFTKNQNRWEQKPAAPEEIERWFQAQAATGIGPVVSHAAYLINLGTPDEALWQRSVNALIDELTRAEQLGILGVVLHPGAHMDAGEAAGIARIVAGLDRAHAATAGYKTLTLLETTAGQGSALGYRFEQLRAMLRRRAGAGARRLLLRHVPRLRGRLRHPHAGDVRRDDGRVRPTAGAGPAEVFPLQRQQEGARLPRRPSRPHRHRRAGAGAVRLHPQRPPLRRRADDPGDPEERRHARGCGEPARAAELDPVKWAYFAMGKLASLVT